MSTLPKKLIRLVLSWYLLFVYQRKYSIPQKYFPCSTKKKKKTDTWAFLAIRKEKKKSQGKGNDILSLS